jgi:hypothetical protein
MVPRDLVAGEREVDLQVLPQGFPQEPGRFLERQPGFPSAAAGSLEGSDAGQGPLGGLENRLALAPVTH